jgi:LysR family transcriptional regulator (chromosome initiation inhibitor)
MNPELLVQSHLRAGRLVELMPDSSVDVPLYWQHTRLKVPTLDRLTRAVTTAARSMLL